MRKSNSVQIDPNSMFLKAIEILHSAKQKGIEILLDNDELQLKLHQDNNIPESLLQEIKENKKLIIDFLSNSNWKSKRVNEDHNKVNRSDRDLIHRIPLSFSQERLWFIDQLEGSVQYHIPTVLRMKGKLNKGALEYALQTIVSRHEVLRTVIREAEDGDAYQYIREPHGWEFSIVDGSGYKEDALGLQQYIERIIKVPFDLSNDYMLRAALIGLDHDEHVLVITLHHIASVAWSKSVLVKEVVELYSSYEEDRPLQLAPLEIQYADYAIWQRQYLDEDVLEKKIGYWKEKLEGVTPLQLPTDHARPLVQSTKGAIASFRIDKEISSKLQLLSQQHGATLFMTLLAAIKVLLYRYSGQQDICIGTPVAGRQQKDVEGLIGFFINTLALRSDIKGAASFTELLQQVRATTLEAYTNQDVPFEKVVNAIVKERDMSRNPLFQVMFVLQNTPEIPELRLGELKLSREGYDHTTSKFDLSFTITRTTGGLQGSVQYCTDLYSEQTIVRMLSHFKELLNSIVKQPLQKIGSLPMLTHAEKQQLLVQFNDTRIEYPKDKTFIDLFEEQAAKTPEAIALVFEEEELSYQQLNDRSNQLAHYLRHRGVKEETLVPI